MYIYNNIVTFLFDNHNRISIMKKVSVSWLHLLIAIIAFLLASPGLKGEVKPEIIGYILNPSNDVHCQIQVEIVESYAWGNVPTIQKEETLVQISYHSFHHISFYLILGSYRLYQPLSIYFSFPYQCPV